MKIHTLIFQDLATKLLHGWGMLWESDDEEEEGENCFVNTVIEYCEDVWMEFVAFWSKQLFFFKLKTSS